MAHDRRDEMKKFDLVNAGTYGSNSQMSWRSVLAGFFVAMLTYAALIALGLGIGGLSLKAVDLGDIEIFSIGAGIWLILSNVLALLAGGFVAARLSTAAGSRIGGLHGLTTAGVFFFVIALQIGLGLRMAGGAAGDFLGFSMRAGGNLLAQPAVQNVIEDALGDVRLERPTDEVIQGLAVRVFQGRYEAAQNYLAANSNLSTTEARNRINNLRTEFTATMEEVQNRAGNFISAAAWTSFITLVLGALAGFFGGSLGARSNYKHPIVTREGNIRESVRIAS